MMEQIEIKRSCGNDIDMVAPLWEQLRQHHYERSAHFKGRFENMTWEKRKHNILKNAVEVLLEYAIEKTTNRLIGFCVTVIKGGEDTFGEIESLFVDENYRKSGLGKLFIENAVSWMNSHYIENQRLCVSVGNEQVLDFYKQFDFEPMFIVLQKTKKLSI